LGLWQGEDDLLLPGLIGSLGEAALLEGDRRHLRDQLGYGLSGRQGRRRLWLGSQKPDGVTEISVDEIKVFRGHKYLTLVYQINAGARRLLWCGPKRRARALLRFFYEFGKERNT